MSTHASSLLLENDSIRMPKGLVVIFPQDLTPGVLGDLFNKGVKAVILKDPRISEIWEGFLGPQNGDLGNFSHLNSMPWQENLFTIARNHVPNDIRRGDMLRFTPGIIGHIARKIVIRPASDGTSLQATPDYFFHDFRKISYANPLLRIVWELMSSVLMGVLPRNRDLSSYSIAIDLLKYPDQDELKSVFALLSDSSGKWTKIGQKVDTYKGLAKGVFNKKIIRDVFGLSLLVPGMNSLLRRLNATMSQSTHESVADGPLTIGAEHIDGSKMFTCLASDRDILKTQVYTQEGWVDLPLATDSLAIFPSQHSIKKFGFTPTLHRILLEKATPDYRETKQNVTLSLSIVDR